MVLSSLFVVVIASVAASPLASVEQAFPAASVLLPTNARIVVFGDEALVFSLERGDGSVEPVTVAERAGNRANVLTLPPLLADEAITITVDVYEGYRFDWIVGDDDDDAAPVLGADEAIVTVSRSQAGTDGPEVWFVRVCMPSLVNAEPVLFRVAGDALDSDLLTDVSDCAGDDEGLGISFVLDGEARGAACFDVAAVDVAGNESAVRQVCADLNPLLTGCAQASPSATWLLSLLGLALVRRRVAR